MSVWPSQTILQRRPLRRRPPARSGRASAFPVAGEQQLLLRNERASCGFGFALFLLVNLILFIRPGELIEGLDDVPIYEVAICLSLFVSIPVIFQQFKSHSLKYSPITVFVLAILPSIFLSSIGHHLLWIGREQINAFLKVQAYFLLLAGLVSTTRRLRIFILFLFVVMTLMSIIVLLGNLGIIQVNSLSAIAMEFDNADTGTAEMVARVRGLGIFNDPNDLSLILAVGTIIGLHFLAAAKNWFARLVWSAPIALLLWVFSLTRSRGGLLSLIAGLGVFVATRFGWRRALLIACLASPLLLLLNGRQTAIDLSNPDDTAQGRMQLWRNSLVLFHGSPIFGIGANELGNTYHIVAHNSFIHTFTETGVVGGTIFAGAMIVPILVCLDMAKKLPRAVAPELATWNFTIMAIAVGYAVGLLSLSRNYTVPAYLSPGLAAALSAIAMRRYPSFRTLMDRALLWRVCAISFLLLGLFEICARFLVR
jgi:O-antigen ligase